MKQTSWTEQSEGVERRKMIAVEEVKFKEGESLMNFICPGKGRSEQESC
jgi:hypothetical protein